MVVTSLKPAPVKTKKTNFKYILLLRLGFLVLASLTCVVFFNIHAIIFASRSAVYSSSAFFLQSTSAIIRNSTTQQALPANDRYDPSKPFAERPTDETTLITMISMHQGATNTYLVERCVRSIRKSGRFTGYIMVLTDPLGFDKYSYTMSWDPKTIVMSALDEDLMPNVTFVHRPLMIAKRFKTLAVKYLKFDNRLGTMTRYLLYMDIDNVISNQLQAFFDDYYTLLMRQYSYGNLSDTSFFFAYRDPGGQQGTWHGGLAMFHREYSMGCLDGWRHQMDKRKYGWDQPLLMQVLANFTRYNCVLHSLPEGHFKLATKDNLVPKPNMTTIIHITNTGRAKRLPHDLQARFIRSALLLQNNETMVGSIAWNDVLPVKTF